MRSSEAKFAVGQMVTHLMFGYRGVIFDVDPEFSADEDWYEQMALSRPPKDRPWYHVLVHDAAHTTYVAERNLEADDSGEPIFDESIPASRLYGRQISRAMVWFLTTSLDVTDPLCGFRAIPLEATVW